MTGTRNGVVALVAGAVFAVGLCLSGMTQTSKVSGFLDLTAPAGWDPSLAFVMIGAIAVHLPFALRARRGGAPLLASTNELPKTKALDARLFVGAALFGIGWGIAGFCPGPAVVSAVTLAPPTLAFVGAMLVGMLLQSLVPARAAGARV